MILALPLIGFLGFLGYYFFMRRPVEESALYGLFAHQREEIVRVHAIETNVHAAGVFVGAFYSVSIGLKSGKELRVTPVGLAQADVMNVLAQELQGASFG